MTWDEIMIPIVRGLVLDVETPYKYSDNLLTRVILVATQIVSQSLLLGYTVNYTDEEITPDITEDQESQNLIALKAACMLQVGQAGKVAEAGMLIKDAIGMIDTRNFALHVISILKSGKSYCDMYEQAVQDNMTNNVYKSAQAIIGPIRQYYLTDTSRRDVSWQN